jgi:hypothetical protein
MTNKQDPLLTLWQQQQVSIPDITELKKRWNKLLWQQRLYYTLDVVAFLFTAGICVWKYQKVQWFGQIWMGLVMVLLLVFTIYVGWLRRHALRDMGTSTEGYLHKLRAQYINNIKIAQLTKNSTWVSLLAVLVLYSGGWFFDTIATDKLLEKIVLTSTILGLLMPIAWHWANKREQKFKNEIAKLNDMLK